MKNNDLNKKRILISRTDSIGDVILTLPMCAWLKSEFPEVEIFFLGRTYTKDVLQCFPAIDTLLFWDEWEQKSFTEQQQLLSDLKIDIFIHVFPNKAIAKLAKACKIKYRIGTSHRLFHLTTCNIRPNFTRKNSDLHEAQLNFKLLGEIYKQEVPTLAKITELVSRFTPKSELTPYLQEVLKTSRRKVILHPKSQGSAVEWPMEKYIQLANQLVENGYRVFFSGTEKEGVLFREFLPKHDEVIDISGKSTLGEFIQFINHCDYLVACSTGPLHIASILGIKAIGLYTDLRPMHPGRWSPIGKNSVALTINSSSPKLADINRIEVNTVLEQIQNFTN